jgi:2,3-bisphosphoglycerate-dependent phosphoglycerate mutase
MQQRWPDRIWIVRHGESAGNVAWKSATEARQPVIDVASRDVDVALSPTGEEQARSLGRWFAGLAADERPNVLLVSPYLRARRTAELVREEGGLAPEAELYCIDERLREKEFGVLDRLTRYGIAERHPDQAEFRRLLGKFYYRPPGGESWCDVILRLRSALDTMSLHYGGERVLIVCHQVIVLCLRYLLENLTEEEILAIDKAGEVKNCSVTTYRFDSRASRLGRMVMEDYNWTVPLEVEGTEVTAEADPKVAAS